MQELIGYNSELAGGVDCQLPVERVLQESCTAHALAFAICVRLLSRASKSLVVSQPGTVSSCALVSVICLRLLVSIQVQALSTVSICVQACR